ncbi:MAG: hypothetical protein ACOVOG_11485, partial [Rubrivivax sp.]
MSKVLEGADVVQRPCRQPCDATPQVLRDQKGRAVGRVLPGAAPDQMFTLGSIPVAYQGTLMQ